jgi:hypothetical protein
MTSEVPRDFSFEFSRWTWNWAWNSGVGGISRVLAKVHVANGRSSLFHACVSQDSRHWAGVSGLPNFYSYTFALKFKSIFFARTIALPAMFGVIVSGRPVVVNCNTISPTQFAFMLPAAPPFNHLVIFLLPDTVLPPGQAAAVYIQIPPATEFKLLGAVSNEKPSAIFRTRNVGAGSSAGEVDEDAMMDGDAAPTVTGDITVGISVEPAAQVEKSIVAMKAASTTPSTGMELVRQAPPSASAVSTKILAQRIIANAFNFLVSFSNSGVSGNEVVPLKSFQDWWTKFERKIENDPTFLERGDGV